MAKGYTKLKYSEPDRERYPKKDEPRKKGDVRPYFEVDRSRIIHSSSFRRLQGKTQVFSPGEGDFYRNRLTHSLEVAQIGKGLALRVGADTDLVESVCLAHDLGHPPFGHAGGNTLAELMKDYGGFEANAQNIRIVTLLEERREDYVGLNLTRSTVDGLLKYKVMYDKSKPNNTKFYYDDECSRNAVKWASKHSYPKSDDKSLECQIMSWADEVAYAVHDFEDALHEKFITPETLNNPALTAIVFPEVETELRKVGVTLDSVSLDMEWNWIIGEMRRYLGMSANETQRTKAGRKHLTSQLITYFIHGVERKESNGATTDRYRYSLHLPQEVQTKQLLLNKFIEIKVMRSYNVQSLEAKGTMMIKKLFEAMMNDPKKLFPDDWRIELDKCNDKGEPVARLVCDYISGMTDAFAGKMYARLFVPGSGSIYEPI